MDTRQLMELAPQQQEWLWARYVELFPPCESDQEAHRKCATKWHKQVEAVRQQVVRWREEPGFAGLETELRRGLSADDALKVVEHYMAAAAILAIQERAQLVQLSWYNPDGSFITGPLADAKADAITAVLKMVESMGKRRKVVDADPADAPVTPSQVMDGR